MTSALNSFYDLRVSPYSYDFLTFLTLAEGCRIRRGLDQLNIFLIKGNRQNNLGRIDEDSTFFSNVILPSLSLLPSINNFHFMEPKDISENDTPYEYTYPFGYSAASPTHGYIGTERIISHLLLEKRAKFVVPENIEKLAKEYLSQFSGKVISIGAREITRDDKNQERALHLPTWKRTIPALMDRGYTPLIIRDTSKAFSQKRLFDDVPECPEASLHLHFRLAIYENVSHNFTKNNGPAELLYFSNSVSTTFYTTDENTPSLCNKFLTLNHGMLKGCARPFTTVKSNFIWGRETSKNIVMTIENSTDHKYTDKLNTFISKEQVMLYLKISAGLLRNRLEFSPILEEDIKLAEFLSKAPQIYGLPIKEDIFQFLKAAEGNKIPSGKVANLISKCSL